MIYRLLAVPVLVLLDILLWCFARDVAAVGTGLLIAWSLGLATNPILDWANIPRPVVWLQLWNHRAPELLGWLERAFFFAAIWLREPVGIGAIGAWFALKVATKWKAWEMFGKIKDEAFGATPVEVAALRSQVGAYVNNRFLIGTLHNVLCGAAGAVAGWWLLK